MTPRGAWGRGGPPDEARCGARKRPPEADVDVVVGGGLAAAGEYMPRCVERRRVEGATFGALLWRCPWAQTASYWAQGGLAAVARVGWKRRSPPERHRGERGAAGRCRFSRRGFWCNGPPSGVQGDSRKARAFTRRGGFRPRRLALGLRAGDTRVRAGISCTRAGARPAEGLFGARRELFPRWWFAKQSAWQVIEGGGACCLRAAGCGTGRGAATGVVLLEHPEIPTAPKSIWLTAGSRVACRAEHPGGGGRIVGRHHQPHGWTRPGLCFAHHGRRSADRGPRSFGQFQPHR